MVAHACNPITWEIQRQEDQFKVSYTMSSSLSESQKTASETLKQTKVT